MTQQTNTSFTLATILWFGVTAALLGFSTVYIVLKLAGNLNNEDKTTKTAIVKPVTLKPNLPLKPKTIKPTSPQKPKASAKVHSDTLQKVGKQDNSLKTLPNNTTEIIKKPAMPVNVVGKAATGNPLTGLNRGEMAALLIRATPLNVPAFNFITMDHQTKNLSQWKGKVVLLNIWATWCIPCRTEMPDLDRLKAILGREKFDVITVSIDKGGLVKPARFFQNLGIRNLVLYGATSSRLTTLLRAPGLPATLLIGKDGKEIARLIGPAHWASPDAVALIKAAIAMP